jgi:starch synthase
MDLLAENADALTPVRSWSCWFRRRRAGGTIARRGFRHRGRIGVVVGYDEALSHLMQGGATLF